jgi:hypothetical protein
MYITEGFVLAAKLSGQVQTSTLPGRKNNFNWTCMVMLMCIQVWCPCMPFQPISMPLVRSARSHTIVGNAIQLNALAFAQLQPPRSNFVLEITEQ